MLGSSPVLALTGGPWSHSRDRFQYQEVDDRSMFVPVTKASYRLDDVNRVGSTIRRALRVAMSGRPGPVHIEFAGHHGDVLEILDTDEPFLVEPRYRELPPYRPAADLADIEAAASLIAASERPVLIAGGGVRQSGSAAVLVDFASAYGIPVATSLTGKDVIPSQHPLSVGVVGLYSRDTANQVVAKADLVIFAGTKAGSQVSHSWRVPGSGADGDSHRPRPRGDRDQLPENDPAGRGRRRGYRSTGRVAHRATPPGSGKLAVDGTISRG